MTGKRTRYSADFKAKVALEALRGELTPAEVQAAKRLRDLGWSFKRIGVALGKSIEDVCQC
jgi:hypothetical protein